jgi:uncharacterized protein
MTPLLFTVLVFAISVGAGVLGSLLGLGGGIIVVPALTLVMRVDIRYAIGASLVSVIATSSGAAAAYVRERMTNLRVAMFLEIATTTGAIMGAYLAGVLGGRWLYVIFGVMMGYSALAMFRKRHDPAPDQVHPDRVADRLRLHGSYFDEAADREIVYRVTRTWLGFVLMYVAGTVSGLLGIGSGALKVPAMDLAMGLPIKVSTATSNFMIGVTAAASAGIYLSRGYVLPSLAMPVMLGVLVGSLVGARVLTRTEVKTIRIGFAAVILALGAEMIFNGITGKL